MKQVSCLGRCLGNRLQIQDHGPLLHPGNREPWQRSPFGHLERRWSDRLACRCPSRLWLQLTSPVANCSNPRHLQWRGRAGISPASQNTDVRF